MHCARRIRQCSRHKPRLRMRPVKPMRHRPPLTSSSRAVTELKGDVTDLKSNIANTVVTLQETQKRIDEPPTAIHVKGITITPGGFVAAEIVRRSRALASDVNTPFNSITMPGASAKHIVGILRFRQAVAPLVAG